MSGDQSGGKYATWSGSWAETRKENDRLIRENYVLRSYVAQLIIIVRKHAGDSLGDSLSRDQVSDEQ